MYRYMYLYIDIGEYVTLITYLFKDCGFYKDYITITGY